ncbi:MAG: neutral zinc metallopeptidase [Tissierellia bacterium]|nr:neutral zinc metallopeptidase [Tissierellia bacterium]
MKWKGRRQSSNVEDRRGMRPSGPRMKRGMGLGGGGMKLGGGTLLILLLLLLLNGGDLGSLLDGGTPVQNTNVNYEHQEELKAFTSTVMADLEDFWSETFEREGRKYHYPTLVLYSGAVDTACGSATSDVGPFYCSGDKKVYIDLSFYEKLKRDFDAPGDFAFAYVLAHEVGHHVQNELGILEQVHSLRQKLSKKEYNEFSVRLELQADYFAGVFARYVQGQGYLEEGDIEEAMNAASAVGDDTIQKKIIGKINPDSFTHGTSEQRMKWFMKGFKNGTIEGGDTFNTNDL